ncbi:hypothetical protein M9458_026010, partial [Cirrhinus mrigala]
MDKSRQGRQETQSLYCIHKGKQGNKEHLERPENKSTTIVQTDYKLEQERIPDAPLKLAQVGGGCVLRREIEGQVHEVEMTWRPVVQETTKGAQENTVEELTEQNNIREKPGQSRGPRWS